MTYKKEYTAEEKAEYKATKQAEAEELVKRIDEGVKAVFQSDKYKEYLKFASKFTDYSARNTMLINMQKPEATLVAAMGKWNQLGRKITKGQGGIKIFAPVVFKKDEVQAIDKPMVDEFGNKQYNPDGTEKTEKGEQAVTGIHFKPTYVFDVSQTNGKELPDPVTELTGDVDSARKEAVFAALKKVTGIDIDFESIKSGAKGYYSAANNKIVINSGMSDAQTLKTAFHEVAHNLLHDPAKKIVTAKSPRNEKEVQAESVAFIVAEKFGIDTSEYSFPYIASWSDGKQLEQLKNALQEIQAAAKKISSEIEMELLKLQKRSLSIDEKLADTELNNIQKAEFLIEDVNDRGVKFSREDTDKILAFAGKNAEIGKTVQLVSDMETIQKQRDSYGYDFSAMTPIDTKAEALKAFDKGEAVYLLYPDNTEGMAEVREDIENFDGYFGIEKDGEPVRELDGELILVSREYALEMWDKNLDVFVDGVRAESREQVEAASTASRFQLQEYQFSAQLEFDKNNRHTNTQAVQKTEIGEKTMPVYTNPNVIGNTPYNELGEKGELMYYKDLKARHADNIAKSLDEKGIPFSGVRKGFTTTITINKRDVSRYEAAVEAVKRSYAAKNTAERKPATAPVYYEKGSRAANIKPESKAPTVKTDNANPNVIGNTPYNELGGKGELEYYKDLKNRHANNIAKALDEQGIPFSGVRKGTVTTITVNKRDIPKYEAVVEAVKQGYAEKTKAAAEKKTEKAKPVERVPEKAPEKSENFADVPICTQSYVEAKQSDNVQAWRENMFASKACREFINTNLYNAYEGRDLKNFAAQLDEKFGNDRVMYTLAATIQLKDHDGRFTQEVKDRAGKYSFDSDDTRLKYLTEEHPVKVNHLYEKLIDLEKELKLAQPEIDKSKLPSLYDDKLLYSSERVELHDDYRGIPETSYYQSSVNEYYIPEIGWLDNESYDREQKLSGINAKDFYAKVTKINANYIDNAGMTGQLDMMAQEYASLTEKTYAPENKPQLDAAKAKLDERRMEAGGIKETPTEVYAVRQMKDGKFAVCAISADGLVTVAKPHIANISEARKAMLDIYWRKQGTARCEFVNPQTLDEKSAALFTAKTELPEVTYRINLDMDKTTGDTHFLQKYTKNADDSYKIDDVVCRGDYDKCNVALADVLKPKIEKQLEEQKKPQFEIYQIKGGEETRDMRFEPYDRLVQHGNKVDFANYDKVYEGNIDMLPTASTELSAKLEAMYQKFNIDHPDDFKGHSLSVSDVVVMDDKAYYVDSVGFKPLSDFKPIEKKKEQQLHTATPEQEKPEAPKPQKKQKSI